MPIRKLIVVHSVQGLDHGWHVNRWLEAAKPQPCPFRPRPRWSQAPPPIRAAAPLSPTAAGPVPQLAPQSQRRAGRVGSARPHPLNPGEQEGKRCVAPSSKLRRAGSVQPQSWSMGGRAARGQASPAPERGKARPQTQSTGGLDWEPGGLLELQRHSRGWGHAWLFGAATPPPAYVTRCPWVG